MTELPNIGRGGKVPFAFSGLNLTNNFSVGQARKADNVDPSAYPNLRGYAETQTAQALPGADTQDVFCEQGNLYASCVGSTVTGRQLYANRRYFVSNAALGTQWGYGAMIADGYDDVISNNYISDMRSRAEELLSQGRQDEYERLASTYGYESGEWRLNLYADAERTLPTQKLSFDELTKVYTPGYLGSSYIQPPSWDASGKVMNGKKSYARIGSKLYVFPDKLEIDVVTNEAVYMAPTVTNAAGTSVTVSADTLSFASPQMDGAAADISEVFSAGDYLTITGGDFDGAAYYKVTAVTAAAITFEANFTAATISSAVYVSRSVPDLDYICSAQNRLWGVDSETNTIYASALGKPSCFGQFEGIDSDSYAVKVDSAGGFTACVQYSGNVLFFKEDKLHIVSGYTPSAYTLYTYDVDGVEAGAEKTCALKNEVLYYKGKNGVYAYSGGTPVKISTALGDMRGEVKKNIQSSTDIVWSDYRGRGERAFFLGDTYFLLLRNKIFRRHISGIDERNEETAMYDCLMYDTASGMWSSALDVCRTGIAVKLDEKAYILRNNALYEVFARDADEASKPFDITFCEVDNATTDKKRLKEVSFYQSGEDDITDVYANGKLLGTATGEGVKVFPIDLRDRKCRLRLNHRAGAGEISELAYTYLEGSNRY